MKLSGGVGWFGVAVLASAMALGCGNSESNSGGPVFAGQPSSVGGTSTGGSAATGGSTPMPNADDGVDCTLDKCDGDTCTHIPRHFMCKSNELCTAVGCRGTPCLIDFECDPKDPCISYSVCTFGVDASFCSYRSRDADGDGAYPVACGGTDCNDDDSTSVGPSPEVCDGKDNDCDGVVDPPEASGCAAPLVCAASKCDCPQPGGTCPDLSGCVDFGSDAQHCGGCEGKCGAGETCSDGKCACPAGQLRCASVCVDPTTDTKNCGDCGVSCGIGECRKGACACAADQTDCKDGEGVDCRETDSDPSNCGGCAQQCLPASGCAAGSCDAEVELVKMYGGADTVASASQLEMDADGNLFAALDATGEHRALPTGQLPLWSSDHALVKLDKNADFLWAVPTNFSILDVATSGSDVWIAVAGGAQIQVGESSFALADQHVGLGLLLKLSGASGAILSVERFDFASAWPQSAELLIGNDGVWVAFGDGGDVDYMGTTSPQLDVPYGTAMFRVGTAKPRWLPGEVTNLAFDANGKIVVSDDAPGFGVSFSFGGDTFTAAKLDRAAAARYTKDLVHEASFMLPFEEYNVSTAFPLGDNVLFVGATADYFETYDFTGKRLAVSGGALPFYLSGVRQSGSEVAGLGYTNDQELTVGARDFAKHSSYFVSIDSASGQIDKAFSVASVPSNGIVTGLSAFATDTTNSSLVVSLFFDGTFDIGAGTYGKTGTSGVAFVKLKLRQP